MSVKYETIKAGDVLWDVHKYRMGNTTMRAWGSWEVKVEKLTPYGAICSWNGNASEQWSKRRLAKLRRSPRKDEG